MRVFLFCLFSSFSLGSSIAAEDEPFEGRIDYAVNSGGMEMAYSFWVKGGLWRSELRSGNQLFELRLGNLGTGEAYLVNEGGESYRALGRAPGMGRDGPPPEGRGGKKGKELNLEKLLVLKDQSMELLDHEVWLEELKGPGKKLHFWWGQGLGALPAEALPRLRGFEGKEQALRVYFRERGEGVPLKIENPKASGKNAFALTAIEIETMELSDAFMSLPDGYKLEAGGRGMGGGRSGGRGPGGGGRRGGPGGGRPQM